MGVYLVLIYHQITPVIVETTNGLPRVVSSSPQSFANTGIAGFLLAKCLPEYMLKAYK